MKDRCSSRLSPAVHGSVMLLISALLVQAASAPVFNIRDYGATGRKSDDARPAIQRAIEACAAAGGGIVRVPPGQYTSGTLHLRSQVRFDIQAGATLFASQDPKSYDCGKVPSKAALFYGEDLQNVTLEGEGTVDGQAEYEWRPDDYERAFDHKAIMLSLGKPLMRSFPKGFPQREIFPHLVWLGRSTNLHVTGLKLLHSPSWTVALYGCERARFDRLQIQTSLKEGVWADGIDLDGCREVLISDCAIETGDDCIALISTDAWGAPLPCENITVTNCRLSSASAGVKFSEGNRVAIRNVRITHSVLTNVNRGFVFSTTLGGQIADVVLSDLVIDCRRYDWFWSGDGQPFYFRITRLSEFNHEPPKAGEPPLGSIRRVLIRNVRARAQGSSTIRGHPESPLEDIRLENVKLSLSADPAAPFDRATNALDFRWVTKLLVKDVEVSWEKPSLVAWQSALWFEEVNGLEVDGFAGRGAWPDRMLPAVALKNVSHALIHRSRALEGTTIFLRVTGPRSRDILFQGNDLRQATVPYTLEPDVPPQAVTARDNARGGGL